MNFQYIISFFAYFTLLLSVGLYFHKKQTSETEFILGNRSLNFWLTAFSAHASDMSAWLFMAFPSLIFIGGVPQFWAALGLLVGMYINWQFIAEKLRVATEKYDSCTLSTYFENRFNDTSGFLRVITALMTVIFLTCYLSAALIAMGFLFESVFGLDYFVGLTIATVVAVTYMFFGGYITVAWTDLFQALFLIFMIVLVPMMAYFSLPEGFHTVALAAKQEGLSINLFVHNSPQELFGVILLSLGWGMGYFGQPHILTKFMGIENPKNIYKSKYVGMTWQFIALSAAGLVGFIGIGFFPEGVINPELVFVEMVKDLFLPLVGGFILCGILAANMSTMDTQILVCASVISEDFYKHLFHKHATQKDLLFVSRISVILIALIALIISFYRSATVLETVFYAWAGLGSSFGPLIFTSLYSTQINRYGAIAGILVGGTLAGLWPLINPLLTSFSIPALIPAFFTSLIAIYGISFTTKKITYSKE